MNKKIIDIINKINEESAKIDFLNENISGYNYMVNNWESYDVCNSKEEFIALLNILQANGETLESLNDCYQNDDREFMSIFGKWDSRPVAICLVGWRPVSITFIIMPMA